MPLPTRVIPTLLLKGRGLVKTMKFDDPKYVGDPRNAMKIFNEKEVDELALLDITATNEGRSPNFELISEIVTEAFMPVSYGGGINNVADARRVINLGVEKVIINSAIATDRSLLSALADDLGRQSVVASIDVKQRRRGRQEVYTHSGKKRTKTDPVTFARSAVDAGAGEILLNSIDRDGRQNGYDIELIQSVVQAVDVPVIAAGGAGSIADLGAAVVEGGAAAVAAGSLFVFQGRHRSVMISYPSRSELDRVFGYEAS